MIPAYFQLIRGLHPPHSRKRKDNRNDDIKDKWQPEVHKIHHFDTAGRLNRVVHIDISTDVKQPSGKSNTDTTAKFYTHGSA